MPSSFPPPEGGPGQAPQREIRDGIRWFAFSTGAWSQDAY
jgi:hypothetical protein